MHAGAPRMERGLSPPPLATLATEKEGGHPVLPGSLTVRGALQPLGLQAAEQLTASLPLFRIPRTNPTSCRNNWGAHCSGCTSTSHKILVERGHH